MATVRAVYKKDLCVKENWHLFIAMMPSEVSGKMVETKCSGVFAPIYEGQPFTFVGEYESYKGCKTFRVKSYAAEMPKGMEESMAFIRSIKGIGKKRGDIISSYCNSTGIPELAADINQGVSDIHFVGGCSVMAMTEDKINKSLTDKYLDAVGRYGIKNVLVLAPTRKESDRTGAICTDNLNQMLRSAANPASEGKKEMKIGERIFRVGDRVINTKNATDCVNGDIGTIASITADSESMTVEFDGGFEVIFDKKRVSKAIELSYAVTVHKSQGGEYDCILMPFVESQSFVLTKALIYTAVTRARKEFIGIGKLELMQTASTRTCKNNGPKDLLVKRIASMLKKREVIAVECSDSNSNKAA